MRKLVFRVVPGSSAVEFLPDILERGHSLCLTMPDGAACCVYLVVNRRIKLNLPSKPGKLDAPSFLQTRVMVIWPERPKEETAVAGVATAVCMFYSVPASSCLKMGEFR